MWFCVAFYFGLAVLLVVFLTHTVTAESTGLFVCLVLFFDFCRGLRGSYSFNSIYLHEHNEERDRDIYTCVSGCHRKLYCF